MNFQASVGISIAHDRVSLVYLKRSLKGIRLVGQAVHQLEPGEGGQQAGQVARLVDDFFNAHEILSADIFLGIQRDLAIVRFLELPLAVRENLRGTLVYEMEKYIPLSVDDIYFDYQIIEADKDTGRMTVLLVAVRRAVIDAYLDVDNRLGTGLSGIEINTTALVNGLLHKPGSSREETHAFLFGGVDHFELGLVKKNRLCHSRHVTTGGEDEKLEPLVTESLDRLRKTAAPLPADLELVLLGEAAPQTAELVRERDDVRPVSVDLSRTGLLSDALVPAYGLAVKGLQKTAQEINLLPVDLRRKTSKMPYYTLVALAGLLLVAVIGWGASSMVYQRHTAAKLQSELERLSTAVEGVNQTRDRVNRLEKRMAALNVLRQRHVPALNILRELSEDVPPDAWFNRLYITVEKGDIEGYAESASALIPLLASSPLLDDVAFLSPITKDGNGKEKFRIGFTLR